MPETPCTIVLPQQKDLAALAPLFDAYRRFFAGHCEIERSRRFLAERFAARDSVIFIARMGDAVLGFIQLYPLWSSWHCRRIWFLSDLYVEEASRKGGVGRRLVDRVVQYAHETDAASIMVELPRREPHLEDFYARLGFRPDELFELARYTTA